MLYQDPCQNFGRSPEYRPASRCRFEFEVFDRFGDVSDFIPAIGPRRRDIQPPVATCRIATASWRSCRVANWAPKKATGRTIEALTELINAKRNGKTIAAKPRPRGENMVDLMDALKKSIAGEASPAKGKKPRKASAGQKEMLLPIEGKKPAAKKGAKPERSTGRRKAG
jgi:hypothetical protein